MGSFDDVVTKLERVEVPSFSNAIRGLDKIDVSRSIWVVGVWLPGIFDCGLFCRVRKRIEKAR